MQHAWNQLLLHGSLGNHFFMQWFRRKPQSILISTTWPHLKKPIQNPSTHNLCYWRKQFLVRRLLQEPPAVPSTFSLVPSTSGIRKSLLLGIFLQACSTFYYCDKTLHKTSVLWTVHGQEGMWGRGEWVAICKQRGEDSEERWYPGSFRADEQPLGLWENKQQ